MILGSVAGGRLAQPVGIKADTSGSSRGRALRLSARLSHRERNDMTDRIRGIRVYPMPEAVGGPPIYGRYALIVREDGEARMIHTEGVAYSVTEDKPWRWNDHIADCPEFTPAELIAIATEVTPVDLADWVRVFGSRLESNFHLISYWYSHTEEP